jgi:hypothetical protein
MKAHKGHPRMIRRRNTMALRMFNTFNTSDVTFSDVRKNAKGHFPAAAASGTVRSERV